MHPTSRTKKPIARKNNNEAAYDAAFFLSQEI
jgi:hypothetical protein